MVAMQEKSSLFSVTFYIKYSVVFSGAMPYFQIYPGTVLYTGGKNIGMVCQFINIVCFDYFKNIGMVC